MSTTPTEKFLHALYTKTGKEPHKNENGWSAHCPAHDDRRPSLSIREAEDGGALVHCHAGCETESICQSVGLRVADLMPDGPSTVSTSTQPRKSRDKWQFRRHRQPKTYETANAAIAALDKVVAKEKGRRVGQWIYQDTDDEPIAVVCRYDLPTPEGEKQQKTFRPVTRCGDRWEICGMPEPRPLYRLPDLAGADRVFITEGEKAADAARAIGLTVTTSAHGSKSPDKTDWSPLAGKYCVILPDNDECGRQYADTVTAILTKLTPAPVVKVVALPDLPDHGDIADWVQVRTDSDAGELRQQVESLAQDAAVIEPDLIASSSECVWRPALVCMADVEARPINWIWSQRIAAGRITLAVGMPGAGKSFLTCDLASRVSTGTPWPDGSECRCGSVVFITAEDDPHDTIRPRLDAHHADVSRIHLLSGVVQIEGGKTKELTFTLADADILRQTLEEIEDCRLVVIDPIGSFLGGRCDAHRDNEVRAVLAPIAKLAEQYGPAVLIVAHRRKSAGVIADDTTLGSRAFTGIARSIWHLSRDAEDRNRRLLLPGKCNLAAEQTGLAFTISGEPPSVHWQDEPVAMTADEALARENGTAGERSAIDEAADWLREILTGGPKPSGELKSHAKRDGIAWRTVERAKAKLGVSNRPDGFGGPWVWALPNVADSVSLRQDFAESAKDESLAETAETVVDSGDAREGADWGEL